MSDSLTLFGLLDSAPDMDYCAPLFRPTLYGLGWAEKKLCMGYGSTEPVKKAHCVTKVRERRPRYHPGPT